ncbi:hypothetical protein Tco_1120129 [Tanacetum coccineum]
MNGCSFGIQLIAYVELLLVELLEKRKKHFAALRAQEKRSKPPTKAQKRNTMSTYLKNMAGYKHNQLKSKSYDEIQEMFDKEMKRVNTFVDMNTELVKGSKTKAEGSSKRAGDELEQEKTKKQKGDDDQEEAEMKRHIEIVKDDEVAIDAIPLATKPLVIVEYQIDKDGRMGYFKLIRAEGSSKKYSSMIKMLQNIDREDLETLWKLVKAKHGNTRPEDDYERVFWEAGTTSTTLTTRLLILNPGEYDLWLMRIEQYFLMTDYSLWEVILNGNKVLKRTVGETEQEYEPTTAEEKHDKRNVMKARGTLLMALPNKDQLKFHSYKDAKLLMEAIKKRLQKLISQLEIQGEVITQDDMNLKLLRSLPSEWKTHAYIWRNKEEIETISLDDLYNNLKKYKDELTGSTNTSQNSQNVAFVSSNSTNINSNNSKNEADNTTYRVSAAHTQSNPTTRDNLSDAVICAFLASQPNSPQLA